MVAAFVLAGLPVWRLTRPATADAAVVSGGDAPPANAPGAKATPLEVEAVFAPAPADFQLQNLGQTVLAGHGPQARFTALWAAAIPAEGVDLVLQARWSASVAGDAAPGAAAGTGPAAARVTLRFADGRQVEKSFWAAANGALTEVITVPGAPSTAAP